MVAGLFGVIYALTDPRSGAIRYVGMSLYPADRLRNHIRTAERGEPTHKGRWVRMLLKLGLEPQMVVLQTVPRAEMADAERTWIARFRAQGLRLTNHTDGGDGTAGRVPSQAQRAKMRAALVGRPLSKEHCEKLRLSHLGFHPSAEARAKVGAFHRGRSKSPEVRAKLRASLMGHPGVVHTPETKAKIGAASRAMWARRKAAA